MASAHLESQIIEIKTALLNRCDALGTAVAETIWREVGYYAETGQVTRDELTANSKKSLRAIFEVLNADSQYETEIAARTGEARALAGIPISAIMEAYRVAARLTWDELVSVAASRPHLSREAFIRATGRLWLAQDVYTSAMAARYRDTMSRKVLNLAAERAALVEALLDGRIIEQAGLWEIAKLLRLPARGPYVIVAAECASIGRSALVGIEARLKSIEIASAWRLLPDVELGLVHVRNNAALDKLTKTLTEIASTRIGVSSRFDDLRRTAQAVKYARTALSVDRRDGSSLVMFEAKPLAIAAVSAPSVMKQVSSAIFADFEERERESLFTTFRMWASTGGSITDTAERLYCHANTVRHRLRRIEELTGKSLNRPLDLAELCLAFEIELLVT